MIKQSCVGNGPSPASIEERPCRESDADASGIAPRDVQRARNSSLGLRGELLPDEARFTQSRCVPNAESRYRGMKCAT
eukprot:1843808-Alexandrium_andersonii.AAC.1